MITSVRQASNGLNHEINGKSTSVERAPNANMKDEREALRRRIKENVERVLSQRVNYIPHTKFEDPKACKEFDMRIPRSSIRGRKSKFLNDLPAHLAVMCEMPILTPDEEVHIFQRMNLQKYRAVLCQQRLIDNPGTYERRQSIVEKFDAHMQNASDVQSEIAMSNIRLVISIVKKFITPSYTFDEALSDGNVSLLRAIENFDFNRGFRFSTYATQVVRRTIFHEIAQRSKYQSRYRNSDELLMEAEYEPALVDAEKVYAQQRLNVAELAARTRLDKRERSIIKWRFGLKRVTGEYPRGIKTFQYLADKFGVSKERIRQIEQRALSKLKIVAAEEGIVDPADD